MVEPDSGPGLSGRRQWLTLSQDDLPDSPASARVKCSRAGMQILRQLGKTAASLADTPIGFYFDVERLRFAYRIGLEDHGFVVRKSGELNVSALARCLGGFLAPLRDISDFNELLHGAADGSFRPDRYAIST
ncbi:MAG TPA: hypothetical protein VF798_03635, partial [Burkholderiaceae bacterium]